MKVLVVEPFYTGSHKKWADGYQSSSQHEVKILSLPGVHWKWRMHGGAVTLSEELNSGGYIPDVIVSTDMLDVTTFRANLIPSLRVVPTIIYFHENQITYPWSENDDDVKLNRNNHYGFINYSSALVSDKVLFNSHYHQSSFVESLPGFLKQFPDYRNTETISRIEAKSEVVPLGLDLVGLNIVNPDDLDLPKRATILWNHRWEYDKNPQAFFDALVEIKRRGWEFNLVVLGEKFNNYPEIFDWAKDELKDQIIHWGYVESFEQYAYWLWYSDILPVTSNQDFFGGSVVEAMYCNVKPLLPKRLAYPEHIPELLHATFFYEEGELINKLQRWVKDISVLRKQQTTQFVSRYDWSQVSSRLDLEIEEVARTHAINR